MYIIVLDNASYHSRQVEKIPTMNTLKADMINFMKDHGIRVHEPIPIKAVLLEKIKMANIKKRFVIDEMASKNGHQVLRLPPYHCCLNPIEMVWHQLKANVRRQNVYSDSPEKVLDLIRRVCDKITPDDWSRYVEHVKKEEESFRKRDNFLDYEIEKCVFVNEPNSLSDESSYEEDSHTDLSETDI